MKITRYKFRKPWLQLRLAIWEGQSILHNAFKLADRYTKFVQGLASTIENRGLKLGKAMYQELTGARKPALDSSNILHWPVLLLYAEVMSSDFIEDFCETDMFSSHLDMISFS